MRKKYSPKRILPKLNPKNEEIRVPYVMVITNTGERLENVPTKEAIQMAYDRELDLVLIAPGATPPVAKIIDWGKYKYEKTKKDQQQRKHQKTIDTKEIRLRPKTDSHDLEIKLRKIREFLGKGHKVKITMMFRGREVVYRDKGREDVQRLIDSLGSTATTEDKVTYQFKRLSVTLAPTSNTPKQVTHEAQNTQRTIQENQDNEKRQN